MRRYHDKLLVGEGVRCGASQKKAPRDSTKTYSPWCFTFWDVPQIAPYHTKLLAFGLNILNPQLLAYRAAIVVLDNLITYRNRLARTYPLVVRGLLKGYRRDGRMRLLSLHKVHTQVVALDTH